MAICVCVCARACKGGYSSYSIFDRFCYLHICFGVVSSPLLSHFSHRGEGGAETEVVLYPEQLRQI